MRKFIPFCVLRLQIMDEIDTDVIESNIVIANFLALNGDEENLPNKY